MEENEKVNILKERSRLLTGLAERGMVSDYILLKITREMRGKSQEERERIAKKYNEKYHF